MGYRRTTIRRLEVTARSTAMMVILSSTASCLLINVKDQSDRGIKGAAAYYSTNGGTSWIPFRSLTPESLYLCENSDPPQPPTTGMVDFRVAKTGFRTLRSQSQLFYVPLKAGAPCEADTNVNAFNFNLYPSPAGWDPGIHKRCVRNADGTSQDSTFCPDGGSWNLFINAEIPQIGNTPRVICPGSEASFGNSYRPNEPGSPIFLEWTQTGNTNYRIAAGIDFVAAGFCPNNLCHYPAQCTGGPYWTFFAIGDSPGNPLSFYPTLNSAWVHVRMRNAGRWLPTASAGAAVSISMVTRWAGVDRHIILAFEPGGARLYADSYPEDPKVLQIGESVDGEVVLMSATGWGFPALTNRFATYDVNISELYNYVRNKYGVFRDAPPASQIVPQLSIQLEVREQSTQWVEFEKYHVGSR